MREFRVNQFITLKLRSPYTHIYISGKIFRQCKRLVINIEKGLEEIYDEIESIEEAIENYKLYLINSEVYEDKNGICGGS